VAAEIDTVRRFREYPERAVMKRRKWQARNIRLRYTGYKRFTAGFPGYARGIELFCGLSIAPATPSFRLAGSHKDGLCGPEQRNGVGQG
jgi:hypothetical protein